VGCSPHLTFNIISQAFLFVKGFFKKSAVWGVKKYTKFVIVGLVFFVKIAQSEVMVVCE
jgi:hypothetical protein